MTYAKNSQLIWNVKLYILKSLRPIFYRPQCNFYWPMSSWPLACEQASHGTPTDDKVIWRALSIGKQCSSVLGACSQASWPPLVSSPVIEPKFNNSSARNDDCSLSFIYFGFFFFVSIQDIEVTDSSSMDPEVWYPAWTQSLFSLTGL